MEATLNEACRVSYSAADEARMDAYLHAAHGKGHDITLSPSMHGTARAEALRNGIVRLNSKNLGCEFVLLNVDAGRNIFGLKKRAVRIYMTKNGTNEFNCLQTTKRLSDGLRAIHKMYTKAADLHLA